MRPNGPTTGYNPEESTYFDPLYYYPDGTKKVGGWKMPSGPLSIQRPGYVAPVKFDPGDPLGKMIDNASKRRMRSLQGLRTAEEDEPDNRKDVFYITYTKTLRNEDGSITVYSGRTRGYGEMTKTNAEKYIRMRDYSHHKNDEGFEGAVYDNMSRSYDAIRGREQQMIDFHGGAIQDRDYRRGTQPGSSGNDRRGVAPGRTPKERLKARRYHEAANNAFGEMFWYTGN
jgi:hypothetical protein